MYINIIIFIFVFYRQPLVTAPAAIAPSTPPPAATQAAPALPPAATQTAPASRVPAARDVPLVVSATELNAPATPSVGPEHPSRRFW